MPKTFIVRPQKYRGFGELNKKLFSLANLLVERPGKWVTIEGMGRQRAYNVIIGIPRAFSPAGAYHAQVRRGVVKLRFVGQVATAADGRRFIAAPGANSEWVLHPENVKEIARDARDMMTELLTLNRSDR